MSAPKVSIGGAVVEGNDLFAISSIAAVIEVVAAAVD
jgi:hypothetical protein